MKKYIGILGVALFILPSLSAHADTTTVWFTPGSDLYAGPDTSFPVVTTIPASAHMELKGCLQGWTWCDVVWNGQRGWVSGQNIESINNQKTMYVTDLGQSLNIPIVTYNTNAYWNTYYKSAPFYTERQRFVEWVPAGPSSATTTR